MRPAPVTDEHLVAPFRRRVTFVPPLFDGPEHCESVAVVYESLPDGDRIRIPYELEDGDLERLTAGDPVWLTIWGGSMPPVGVDVGVLP